MLGDLKFDCLRNALYHAARRDWLDMCSRWLNFIVIFAGAAVVGDMEKLFGASWTTFAAGAVAALAGTFQLVFDYANRARTHEFLQKRYYELLAEIEENPEPGADLLARWQGILMRIYADEPPVLRALDAIAYNAASCSMDRDEVNKVGFWQSLLRHLYAYNGTQFALVPRKRPAAEPSKT